MYNQNSGYGASVLATAPFTTGKIFVVAAASAGNNYDNLTQIFKHDPDGVQRIFTTPTLALAQCVANRGDVIVIDRSYTTAISDAEMASADTKGVAIYGTNQKGDVYIATRATATLPATTNGNLFRCTGTVLLKQIWGEVTTVIQTQACNLKLNVYHGTTATDICANLDISANAKGSRYSITGTFGNALINTAVGVPVAKQATEIVIQKDSLIRATTSATNTGSVRWACVYRAMESGAQILAV